MDEKLYLSIIVPLFDEEGNVKELHRRIFKAAEKLGKTFEIIFVDDGSSDGTVKECQNLSPLTLISFRKNFGQTAAMDAGIKQAKGEIIITMDGDLQNDPDDIKLLLDEMDKDYDIVSGWRWKRKDSLMKKFFSRGANLLRKILVHDNIHDSGCSLKAYKRECFKDIDLFGEMHRFIPGILKWQGFKISEVKVEHAPRKHGQTKYSSNRILRGFVDMIGVWFWRKYSSRPLHLFGGGGLLVFGGGFIMMIVLFFLRFFDMISLSDRIWPIIAIFLMLAGMQLFVSGLLAEMLVKNYFSGNKKPYNIEKVEEN